MKETYYNKKLIPRFHLPTKTMEHFMILRVILAHIDHANLLCIFPILECLLEELNTSYDKSFGYKNFYKKVGTNIRLAVSRR